MVKAAAKNPNKMNHKVHGINKFGDKFLYEIKKSTKARHSTKENNLIV
jgi:hypothetical protein